jgi:hypothetical protein
MKRYPLIGVPTPITVPAEQMDAIEGIVLDLGGTFGQDVDIALGMILQNEGATARLAGRTALVVQNTHLSVALVVTPVVTTVLTEAGGEAILPDVTPITIPAGKVALIGPFTQAYENAEKKVTFNFTGTEGRCYAIYIR